MNKNKILIEKIAGTLQLIFSTVFLMGTIFSFFFLREFLPLIYFILAAVFSVLLLILANSLLKRYDEKKRRKDTKNLIKIENLKNFAVFILDLADFVLLVVFVPVSYILSEYIILNLLLAAGFIFFIFLSLALSILNVVALCMKHRKANKIF